MNSSNPRFKVRIEASSRTVLTGKGKHRSDFRNAPSVVRLSENLVEDRRTEVGAHSPAEPIDGFGQGWDFQQGVLVWLWEMPKKIGRTTANLGVNIKQEPMKPMVLFLMQCPSFSDGQRLICMLPKILELRLSVLGRTM